MSLESALQRVNELNTLVDGTSGAATGAAQRTDGSAFATALTQAQLAQLGAEDPGQQGGFDAGDGLAGLDASPYGMAAAAKLRYGMSSSAAGQYAGAGNFPGGAGGISTYPGAYFPGIGAAGGVSPFAGPLAGGTAGERMVQLAQQEVGVRESQAGSNDSPRIREYRTATAGAENTPGPWCAYFVSYLAQQAGAPIGTNGQGVGYVPSLESWGRSTGRYIDGAQQPSPGDIAIFDWGGGGGTADHTGIVERVDPDGTVHTIEGNSSDMVARRTYPPGAASIKGYVRPG